MEVHHQNTIPIIKNYPLQCSKVPMTDRSYPSSPIKKETLTFRYSAPEIEPNLNYTMSASRKVNRLINDRQQVNLFFSALL